MLKIVNELIVPIGNFPNAGRNYLLTLKFGV